MLLLRNSLKPLIAIALTVGLGAAALAASPGEASAAGNVCGSNYVSVQSVKLVDTAGHVGGTLRIYMTKSASKWCAVTVNNGVTAGKNVKTSVGIRNKQLNMIQQKTGDRTMAGPMYLNFYPQFDTFVGQITDGNHVYFGKLLWVEG